MLTINEIKEYFKLENSTPNKDLGQNFLIDHDAILKIIDSLDLKKEDKLLEVGPGLGSLTDDLVGKTIDFSVVEYDTKFVKFLNNSYEGKNIKIIHSNILKYKDIYQNKVIGNLPYYITTDIIEYLLLNFESIKLAVFMMQEECYERITALKGKDFNSINVFLKYLFNIEKVLKVNKTSFYPVPSVNSIVIKLTKKEEKNIGFAQILYKIARILFQNRRKTIFNNLNTLLKNKENTLKVLEDTNLEPNLRAEQLKLEDFENITNVLLKLQVFKL